MDKPIRDFPVAPAVDPATLFTVVEQVTTNLNFKIPFSASASYSYYTVTVAQAQTLATNSTFVPNAMYKITDPEGRADGTYIVVQATAVNKISAYCSVQGHPTYNTMYGEFDLDNNLFSLIHNFEFNATIKQSTTGFVSNALTAFLDEDIQVFYSVLEDTTVVIASGQMVVNLCKSHQGILRTNIDQDTFTGCNFETAADVTLTGGTATNCTFEAGAVVTFGNSILGDNCFFGTDCIVTLTPSGTLTVGNCHFGAETVVTFTGVRLTACRFDATIASLANISITTGTHRNKIYTAGLSTFEANFVGAVNLAIDMTNFTWVGVMNIITNPSTLDAITNTNGNHPIAIYPRADSQIRDWTVAVNAAKNIRLDSVTVAGTGIIALDSNKADRMILQMLSAPGFGADQMIMQYVNVH